MADEKYPMSEVELDYLELSEEKDRFCKIKESFTYLKYNNGDGDYINRIDIQILDRFEHFMYYQGVSTDNENGLTEALKEEKNYNSLEKLVNERVSLDYGWFYKSYNGIQKSLLMKNKVSKSTITRSIKRMCEQKWLVRRKSEISNMPKMYDYRLLFKKIMYDLAREGVKYKPRTEVINDLKKS